MTDIPTTVKNKQLVEKRREQIVRAGIKLFSQRGFHGTSLRELAEEARLSYGNIYDYVGSKEDIFSLIHDFAANLVMAALRSAIENITDPIEKLRRIVRAEFNVMDQWADAILLIYQESHILSKPYLHKLLGKEREHLELVEEAIAEAKGAGRIRPCNVRLTANFIKSMIDAWVIKRWDLRGHANRLEVEQAILDLIFNGLLIADHASGSVGRKGHNSERELIGGWEGQTVFVANGGTPLGSAICTSFLSRGATVAVYSDAADLNRAKRFVFDGQLEKASSFTSETYGPMSFELFEKIESEIGPVDLYVHDLGAGTVKEADEGWENLGERLVANLRTAEEVAAKLEAEVSRHLPSQIIYLAPWGWDQFAAPLCFETVRAGAVALTKAMAAALAGRGVNVNCVVPGFIGTSRPSEIEKRYREEIEQRIPAGRLGQISDVTEPVAFLASPGAKYITGQVIVVGGGLGPGVQ